jgi:site-specific recombinase XerD
METLGDLRQLAKSHDRHLAAENKAPKTRQTYGEGVGQLIDYLESTGITDLTSIKSEHIEEFITDLLQHRSPATAQNRFRALQQFLKWLVSEEHLGTNLMARMRPPHVPEQPVPVVPEQVIKALLGTCGSKSSFEDLRDGAIILLLADTGIRRGELVGLRCDDVDLDDNVVTVLGKGRRPRVVPIGKRTARALDRYATIRRRHEHSHLTEFWVGRQGRFTASGVRLMLDRRADEARVPHVHPHQFRHTFAHQWLANGGQEGDLKRLAGWKSPQMLARYGASAADERARHAHRQHSFGDRL